MNTNWKRIVEKTQAETYILPPGWTGRDEVAEQLGCSPDRVRLLMVPAIKARDVEARVFPVWDPVTKRVQRVTAYHEIVGKK